MEDIPWTGFDRYDYEMHLKQSEEERLSLDDNHKIIIKPETIKTLDTD